jgi:hypothetical protein
MHKYGNHKKCKECGHDLGDMMGLDKAMAGGDKHDYKMNDDDDMKLSLLDELQDSMGSGMDGNIKIIISSRGNPKNKKGY